MEMHSLFHRDINLRVANEGVARVWDDSALVEELREYVVTEAIERHMLGFLSAFVESMEARKKGQGRDGMAVWVSGFFGSGKSHFAKVIGHLLSNRVVDETSAQKAIDIFLPHVDSGPNAAELKALFHQVANLTWVHPILLEIKSKENLSNPNSVAEICLSSFYSSLGYSPTIYVARIEKMLDERGVYDTFKTYYLQQFHEEWAAGREKHVFNRKRIAQALQHVMPEHFPDLTAAEKGYQDARDTSSITVESFSDELLDYLGTQRKANPQRMPHIVFILDEVQQFIGDNGQKILELQSIVERLGSKGKGQVWVVATGQERLDSVIDRTNIRVNELGKLTARFSDRYHLDSADVQKVVRERLLKKRPAEIHHLKQLYNSHEGYLAELCRLNTERTLPGVNEPDFCAYYPFLPYVPTLSQDIFDTMRGIRISGSERSMLTVTQNILKKMAQKPVGALVSLDLVFDEIETELCSSDYLGSDGVRAIRDSDTRLTDWSAVSPSRCLKALWLAQRLNWIPRSAETLSKLLVDTVGEDLAAYRQKVIETFALLQKGGYVSHDEATGQYKYLTAEEGEVEKALVDKSVFLTNNAAVRKAKEYAKDKVLTSAKLGQYRVAYGQGVFDFQILVDGEEVGGKGEVRVECYGPLYNVKEDALIQANLKQGDKGKIVYWAAKQTPALLDRLKRLEALQWLTSDPSHTSGRSPQYLQAVDDKRIEMKALEDTIFKQMEDAFKVGHLYYGGQESQLDGKKDLRAVIKDVYQTLVPNLYDRFDDADKSFDAKAVEKFLLPTIAKLDSLCPDLGLFDGSNQLIAHGPLVETILDELQRREDEGTETDLEGEALLAHFERIPFGWPNDLVRLVLAALLRGGAVALVAGGKKIYDYTDPLAVEYLTKTTKFRNARFVRIKTGLSPSQIQQARSELLALGVKGVQESANDLARALRKEAAEYIALADSAMTRIKYGLPLPDTSMKAETACRPLIGEDDPTVVVSSFLSKTSDWKELKDFFDTLGDFVRDSKDRRFTDYQRLVILCRDNAPLSRTPQADAVIKALADLDAMVTTKEVVSQWTTYVTHAEALLTAYRMAYQNAYQCLSGEIAALKSETEAGVEWQALNPERKSAVTLPYFGHNGKIGLPPDLAVASLSDLLAASSKYPLTTLEALDTALPALRTELLRALQDAYAAQLEEDGQPKPKVRHWSPKTHFQGKTFTPDAIAEVDAAVGKLAQDIKALLADGYTVIIE